MHFIDGLRDPDAQKFASLRKPIDLVMTMKFSHNWEEFEINQECQLKLRQEFEGSGGWSSSQACVMESLCMDGHVKEEKVERGSTGNEMLQAQLCVLQEQIERESILHSESIKALLEKILALEITKGEGQLEAQ